MGLHRNSDRERFLVLDDFMRAGKSNPRTWLDLLARTWTDTQNMIWLMDNSRKHPQLLLILSSEQPHYWEVWVLWELLKLRTDIEEGVLLMKRTCTEISLFLSKIWFLKEGATKEWLMLVLFRSVYSACCCFDLFSSSLIVMTLLASSRDSFATACLLGIAKIVLLPVCFTWKKTLVWGLRDRSTFEFCLLCRIPFNVSNNFDNRD